MSDFRIMPAQHMERVDATCRRWGFPIFDHPNGDPEGGFYIASWATLAEATAAVFALGYMPSAIVPITVAVPEDGANGRRW